jgi:hypothetical protein
MKIQPRAAVEWTLFVLALASTAALGAAAPRVDIMPAPRRQASVDLAERLAQRPAPEPLPADMPSPFNPADFDKPDPAQAKAGGAVAGGPGAGGGKPGAAAPAPAAAPVASGDREILEMLAERITPSGMIALGGRPRIIVSGKPLEIGTRFTVTYKDQDYELELVAIQGNNFTLRYRNEETVRPIKPR